MIVSVSYNKLTYCIVHDNLTFAVLSLLALAEAQSSENVSVPTPQSSIVGGIDAKPGEFPHQVKL